MGKDAEIMPIEGSTTVQMLVSLISLAGFVSKSVTYVLLGTRIVCSSRSSALTGIICSEPLPRHPDQDLQPVNTDDHHETTEQKNEPKASLLSSVDL